MKKHTIYHHATLLIAFIALLFSFAYPVMAEAQVYRAGLGGPYGRIFPQQAYRGIFTVIKYPEIELDGQRENLMPGTRVIDTKNRIVMPATLTGEGKLVNYIRSADGRLNTVWILTSREAQEKRPVADPSWWQKLREKLKDQL